MTTTESVASYERLLLERLRVEDFYTREAELLDERRFEEWLATLADDIAYRVPIAQNVHSSDAATTEFFEGDLDIYWMDEGKETLEKRVEQFRTGIHWAEEPVSRTVHMTTNVKVRERDEETGALTVSCNFLVYRSRGHVEQDFMVGRRVDLLHPEGDSWLVRRRTVYLEQTVLLPKNLTTFL